MHARDETFLNTPPCPFRRVSFGAAHCTISTDAHFSEVDPLTCHNCEVVNIIAEPRCRYLSLGTELKPYRGEGKLVVAMACRALNIKLYKLSICDECPLYNEVPDLVDTIRQQRQKAEVTLPVRESLLDEIVRDIKLDYGIRQEETPPLKAIRCWRFPEGHCRKLPVYVASKVTVILKFNDRNNEIYQKAIQPALTKLRLQPYRLDKEPTTDDEMCRICENIQEGEFVIMSLDDWNASSMVLSGVAFGLGRQTLLLKNESLQSVPLLNELQHHLVVYASISELQSKIVEALAPHVSYREEDDREG